LTSSETGSQTKLDNLIANYSDHGHIPWNVYEIAKYYRKHAKYQEAIKLYRYIVDSWPTADHAMWSQLDLAMSYDTIGDDPNAEAAIDKLVTKFSKNQHIAGVVYEVAKSYRRAEKHEKANQTCNLIIDKWAQSEHALWAQRDLAIFNISSGDLPNAQAAVDKLLADFSSQGRIAQAVYDIAKQYHALQKYEEAGLLYQHVIDNWPQNEYAMWAQADLAKLYIDIGNDAAAEAALDSLIADFNDHPDLPEAVFVVGEQYYNKACVMEDEGRRTEAKSYFRKTITVFERIIQELPATTTTYAYHLLADCYQRFGDRYCGAYVVWHTLQHHELGKPIDVIVKEMQIEKKSSISIYEIVQALETNAISAHAVKLSLDKITTIDRPFIQYIAPIKGQQFGHFRLCIPTGSGKAVILDGAEEPKVIDLTFLEEHDYQETRWDGTSILIDGIIKKTSDAPISRGLILMAEIAVAWLEPDSSDGDLSLDTQLSLLGGCHDDCRNIGRNCFTSPTCTDADDCEPGPFVCADRTQEENCQTPGWWPDCSYDPAHWCSPKRMLSGNCEEVLGQPPKYCGTTEPNWGSCDAETGPSRLWIRQCGWW